MSGVVTENPDTLSFDVPGDDSPINIITPLSISKLSDSQSLIILNQEICIPSKVFIKLWQSTKLHIAVDGGAERLLEYCQNGNLDVDEYKPDYIIGDFDSVSDVTLKKYGSMGVVIIHQETQYSTDLMKALSLCNLVLYFGYTGAKVDDYDGIAQLETKNKRESSVPLAKNKIFIIGGIGGRLDQTIHSISLLYKFQVSNSHLELYFINKNFEDLIFIIPKGDNFIKINTDTAIEKRIIGLLPFGPEVELQTKGLKWDVSGWKSEIGTQVSSSNHVVNINGVAVQNDRDFIMNMSLFENDFV